MSTEITKAEKIGAVLMIVITLIIGFILGAIIF